MVDILGCTGFLNNGAVIEDEDTGIKPNFLNLKTQCYFKLADMIKDGSIGIECIPCYEMSGEEIEDMIIEELSLVREIDIDKDGKRRIISKKELKEELGRSPDRADNLMMRMLPILKKAPDMSWALRNNQ